MCPCFIASTAFWLLVSTGTPNSILPPAEKCRFSLHFSSHCLLVLRCFGNSPPSVGPSHRSAAFPNSLETNVFCILACPVFREGVRTHPWPKFVCIFVHLGLIMMDVGYEVCRSNLPKWIGCNLIFSYFFGTQLRFIRFLTKWHVISSLALIQILFRLHLNQLSPMCKIVL